MAVSYANRDHRKRTVPALSSLSIASVADQVEALPLPDPVAAVPDLRSVLAGVVDPRRRRGVRHGLLVVLTSAVCAVAAGARSFVAIAEWVADLPADAATTLGVDRRCPSESTIRRLLGRIDADRFDAAIGVFLQRLCAAGKPSGRRRVLAVDGKTLRGSRHASADGEIPGKHLLAVIDQHTRTVLGQLAVDGKSNEITVFTCLLERLTGLPLAGVVITADALHTQREHVAWLARQGAHWVLTVKGNQPTLRRQLAGLPWKGLEPDHRSVETAHGRREIRTLTVLTVAAGIAFPGACQAIRITRRTRKVNARTGRPGTWRTETVYAITDLPPPPGSTRRAGRLDPRTLADRERSALGPRRHARRGPVPDPRRQRPAGHGQPPQRRDQPAPPRRRYQHRRSPTTSRPQPEPASPATQDQLTLPTPWDGCQLTPPRRPDPVHEFRGSHSSDGSRWLAHVVPWCSQFRVRPPGGVTWV
jgi:predicted transposase YbfD/YdcC